MSENPSSLVELGKTQIKLPHETENLLRQMAAFVFCLTLSQTRRICYWYISSWVEQMWQREGRWIFSLVLLNHLFPVSRVFWDAKMISKFQLNLLNNFTWNQTKGKEAMSVGRRVVHLQFLLVSSSPKRDSEGSLDALKCYSRSSQPPSFPSSILLALTQHQPPVWTHIASTPKEEGLVTRLSYSELGYCWSFWLRLSHFALTCRLGEK